LILLVFMMIFTNVWGYVEPVSSLFRNKFWLPFALITGLLTVLSTTHARKNAAAFPQTAAEHKAGWALVLLGLFLLTAGFALGTTRITSAADSEVDALLVMTYNIQAANDQAGEKAYERQLELIQQISPDIVAFQESDTARISLNNNDFVRFFAGKLGYYSYYGPTTVAGTFGTAILSRFPLQSPHTIFSYSDQDEIGTAVVSVEIDGQTFSIYNVHPDGSDTAMLAFARTLLADAAGKERVIALGDYNLREDEAAYQMINAVFSNAWTSVYPSGISEEGVDMSGRKRIDHIFLSPDLRAGDPVYLLPPESHTDHPVHWSLVLWGE
jgi:endonuclease/exonuclease/phosphatase family metal-dependent hydrolase